MEALQLVGRRGLAAACPTLQEYHSTTGCSGSRADFRPVGIGFETLGEFRYG